MSITSSTQASSLPPMEYPIGGETTWRKIEMEARFDKDRLLLDTLSFAERWARMIQDELRPRGLARLGLALRNMFGTPPTPKDLLDVDVWEIMGRADEESGIYPHAYAFQRAVHILSACWVHGPMLLKVCEATNFHRPPRG